MNPWQVAFVVLQVVFTLALTGFLIVLKMFYKDVKTIDLRVSGLERKQAVDDQKFIDFGKRLDKIDRNITRVYDKIDEIKDMKAGG